MTFNFKPVTHVLFDLDGLLLDSETLYTTAFTRVCAKYHKEFTWKIKMSLLGLQGHECADRIIEILELPITRDQFMKETGEVYKVLFPDVKLMPGARRVVEHLHKHNIPIALATSSSQESVDLKSIHYGDLMALFHHKTMGSSDPEVTKGKPDPAIFLVCASRFPDKPKPENCLVMEDAHNGVRAALAAGMQVVMVPDPRLPPSLAEGATQVLSSMEEFRPELFGLPPFE